MISSVQNAEYFLRHTVTSRLAECINIYVGEDTLSLAKQFLGEKTILGGGGGGGGTIWVQNRTLMRQKILLEGKNDNIEVRKVHGAFPQNTYFQAQKRIFYPRKTIFSTPETGPTQPKKRDMFLVSAVNFLFNKCFMTAKKNSPPPTPPPTKHTHIFSL